MTTYYSVDEYKESFDAPSGDKQQPPVDDDKGMSTTTIVIIVVVIVAVVGIGVAVGVILMKRAKAKKIMNNVGDGAGNTPDVQLGGKKIRSTDEVLSSVEQPMTNSPVELGTSDIL